MKQAKKEESDDEEDDEDDDEESSEGICVYQKLPLPSISLCVQLKCSIFKTIFFMLKN